MKRVSTGFSKHMRIVESATRGINPDVVRKISDKTDKPLWRMVWANARADTIVRVRGRL